MKNQKRREREIVALRMKIERREENENKKNQRHTKNLMNKISEKKLLL